MLASFQKKCAAQSHFLKIHSLQSLLAWGGGGFFAYFVYTGNLTKALSPLTLFTGLAILTAWCACAALIVLALRERRHSARRQMFLHWALAFFLLVLVKIPAFLAAAGFSFVIEDLTAYAAVAFPARIAAYALFFRGLALVLSLNIFWRNVAPLVTFFGGAFAVFFLLFSVGASPAEAGNILRFFHYTAIASLIFLGACVAIHGRRAPNAYGFLFLVAGWLVFLAADLYIALGYRDIPARIWFLNLVASPFASIGFSIAHALLFTGFVLIASPMRQAAKTLRQSLLSRFLPRFNV